MKKIKFILFVFFISNCHLAVFSNNDINYNEDSRLKANISFTENKGQVSDQNFKAQPNVLYSGTDGSLVFHLKNKGISYQLSRVETWNTTDSFLPKKNHGTSHKDPKQITTFRLDINWLNANTNANIINGEALDGYNNYYLDHCPNGALN